MRVREPRIRVFLRRLTPSPIRSFVPLATPYHGIYRLRPTLTESISTESTQSPSIQLPIRVLVYPSKAIAVIRSPSPPFCASPGLLRPGFSNLKCPKARQHYTPTFLSRRPNSQASPSGLAYVAYWSGTSYSCERGAGGTLCRGGAVHSLLPTRQFKTRRLREEMTRGANFRSPCARPRTPRLGEAML